MAVSYNKKTWVDRVADNIGGRTLVDDTTGTRTNVTVELNEGTVYTEGDPLNATTFNDLENRIQAGFNSIPASTNVVVTPTLQSGEKVADISVDGVVHSIYATDYSNALILDVTSVGV